jgi:hypothetical protein
MLSHAWPNRCGGPNGSPRNREGLGLAGIPGSLRLGSGERSAASEVKPPVAYPYRAADDSSRHPVPQRRWMIRCPSRARHPTIHRSPAARHGLALAKGPRLWSGFAGWRGLFCRPSSSCGRFAIRRGPALRSVPVMLSHAWPNRCGGPNGSPRNREGLGLAGIPGSLHLGSGERSAASEVKPPVAYPYRAADDSSRHPVPQGGARRDGDGSGRRPWMLRSPAARHGLALAKGWAG